MDPSRLWNRHGGGGGVGEPTTPVQHPTTQTRSASYVPRPTPSSAPPSSLNPNRVPNHSLIPLQSHDEPPAHRPAVHEPNRGQQLQDNAHGSLGTGHAPQHHGVPPGEQSRQPVFIPRVQPSPYYTPQAPRSRTWVQPVEWNERVPDPERSRIPVVPEAAKHLPAYIPTPLPTAAEPSLRPVDVPAFHGIIAFVQKTGRSEEERRVLQNAILAYGGQLAPENNPYRGITHLVVAIPEYIRSERVCGGVEVTVAKPQGDTRPGPRPTANADLVALVRWYCKFTDDKTRGPGFQVVTQDWVHAAIRRSTFHVNKSWISDFQVFGRWSDSTSTGTDTAPKSLPSATSQQSSTTAAADDSTKRTRAPADYPSSPVSISPWSREQPSSSPPNGLHSSPCPPPGRRAAHAPSPSSIPVTRPSSSDSQPRALAFADIIDLTSSPFVPAAASPHGDKPLGASSVPEGPAESSLVATGASQTEAPAPQKQMDLPTSPPQKQGHVLAAVIGNAGGNDASEATEQPASTSPSMIPVVKAASRPTTSNDEATGPPAANSKASVTRQATLNISTESSAPQPHVPAVTQRPTEETALEHTDVSEPTNDAEVIAQEALAAETIHAGKVAHVGNGPHVDEVARADTSTHATHLDDNVELPVDKSLDTLVTAVTQKAASIKLPDDAPVTTEASVTGEPVPCRDITQQPVIKETTAVAAPTRAPTASSTPAAPAVTPTGQQQATTPHIYQHSTAQPSKPVEAAPTEVIKEAPSGDPEGDPQLFAHCKEHEQVKAWMVDCRPSDQLPVTRMGGVIAKSYEECSVVILPLGIGEPVTNPDHVALLKGPYPFMLVRRAVLSRQWPFDCYDQRRFLPLDKYIIDLEAIPTPESSVPHELQQARAEDGSLLLGPTSSSAAAPADIPAPTVERSNPTSTETIPTPPDIEVPSNSLENSVSPSRENLGGTGAGNTPIPSRVGNVSEPASGEYPAEDNSGAPPKKSDPTPNTEQSPSSAAPGSDPTPSVGELPSIQIVQNSDTERLVLEVSVPPPVPSEEISVLAPPHGNFTPSANATNHVVNATVSPAEERPASSWSADCPALGPSPSSAQSPAVQPSAGRDMEMSDMSSMKLDSPQTAHRLAPTTERCSTVATPKASEPAYRPIAHLTSGSVAQTLFSQTSVSEAEESAHSANNAIPVDTVAQETNQLLADVQQSNVQNQTPLDALATITTPDTQATSSSTQVLINADAEPPSRPLPLAAAPMGHAHVPIPTVPASSTAAKGKRKKRHSTDNWKSTALGSSAADSVKRRRRTLSAAEQPPQNDGSGDNQSPEAEVSNTTRAVPLRTYSRRGRPAPIRVGTGIATPGPSTPAYRRTSPRKRNAAAAELDELDGSLISGNITAQLANPYPTTSTLPSDRGSALLTAASGTDTPAKLVGMPSTAALPDKPVTAGPIFLAEDKLYSVWTRLLEACPDRSKYSFQHYLKRASHKEGLRCGEHYQESLLRSFLKRHPEAVQGFISSATVDNARSRKLTAEERKRKLPKTRWRSTAHRVAVAELLEVAEEELDDYASLDDFFKMAWISPRMTSTPAELYAWYTEYLHAMCPAMAEKAQQGIAARADSYRRSSSNPSNPDGDASWETASEGQVDDAPGPSAHVAHPMVIDQVPRPFGDEPWHARPSLLSGSNQLPPINPGPYSIDREPGAAPQIALQGYSGYAPYAFSAPSEAGPSQPRGPEMPYYPSHGVNTSPDSPSPYRYGLDSLLDPGNPPAGPSERGPRQLNPMPEPSQQRRHPRYWL